jgi:transcriptional regulator with XRE-family HTH domain
MNVGEQIREARKRYGMNQGELAEKISVSLDTVSRWETGKRMPRAEDLAKLALVLGVSVAYLMGETSKMLPNQKELKDVIKERRQLFHNTIEQLAVDIGVSPETVRDWEAGIKIPTKEQLKKMNLLSPKLEELLDKGIAPGPGEYSLLCGFIPEKTLSLEEIKQREQIRRMGMPLMKKYHQRQEAISNTISQGSPEVLPGEVIEELARFNKLLDQTAWCFDDDEKDIVISILKRCIKTLEKESPKDIESAKTA